MTVFIEDQIIELKKQYDDAFIMLHEAQEKVTSISNKLSELVEEQDEKFLSSITIDNVDWDYLLSNADRNTTAKHKKTLQIFDSLRKKYNLAYFSICPLGYRLDTKQTVIRIALIQNDIVHTQKVINALNVLIPHIIPKKDGFKYIDIFEHTLSEFKSFKLIINEQNQAKVSSGYSQWDTIEKVMFYIQKRHWYISVKEFLSG